MNVGRVSSARPGRDRNDRENGSIDLWGSANIKSGRTLVAHIGRRNCEIKPFPVREGVPTTIVLVLFTPVLSSGCGLEGGSLIKNKSCCTETNKGENAEKAENPIGEYIHTAERLCVITKFGEEPVGFRYDIWFRCLVLHNGVLGEVCPCLFDKLAARDVANGNDKERYCCEEWG